LIYKCGVDVEQYFFKTPCILNLVKILSKYSEYAILFLRFALGGIFAFFGVQAVLDPALHLGIWFAPWVQALPLIGTTQFVFVLGVLEILVALALILGVGIRYASILAAGMLVGIIVNLGFGEIAYRDIVLLAGALVLATQKEYRFALKAEI